MAKVNLGHFLCSWPNNKYLIPHNKYTNERLAYNLAKNSRFAA